MLEEINVIRKSWKHEKLKIALVYPNSYAAMAGLTVQTLYNLWNQHPLVLCERFFLPSQNFSFTSHKNSQKNKKNVFLKSNVSKYTNSENPGKIFPPLRSLENQQPLSTFDIIAFSVSYELDYPNICWFLENANIPVFRKQREIIRSEKNKDENVPIVIVGGHAIRSNPLLISDFVDFAFIGEIEPVNDQFLQSWITAYEDPKNMTYYGIQSAFISEISSLPGFWNTHYDFLNLNNQNASKISRVFVDNLDSIPHPIQQILPTGSDIDLNDLPFGDSVYVEVNRGCKYFCRFCITGAQLKPFRNRSLENIKNIVLQAIPFSKSKKIVLIGSTVTDHPDFEEICQFLVENKILFSIPSIRIDTINSKIAELLSLEGMKTIAIAPETGSERLRKIVNKHITNEQIINGAKILFENGIPNLKLYLLYGLPFETDEDLAEIPVLVRKIAALGYGKNAIKLSINPFIPKAHTPFERYIDLYKDPNMGELKRKYKIITDTLKGDRQVKIETLPLDEAYLQTIWALGDQKFSDLIYLCYQSGFLIKNWFKIVKNKQLSYFSQISKYFEVLESSDFDQNAWNFIDQHMKPSILKNEFEKAKNK